MPNGSSLLALDQALDADPRWLAHARDTAVDVGAIEGVDQAALACHYCGCRHNNPCLLRADSTPYSMAEVRAINAGAALPRGAAYPCGWHRIVETAPAMYFAVCTNAECVRAHLGDASAP